MEERTLIIANETGEIVSSDDAWERHQRIISLRAKMEETFLDLAAELYAFNAHEQYKQIGHETFNSYVADPEVDIGRRMAYMMMRVHSYLVLGLKSATVALLPVGIAKADCVAAYVKKGDIDTTNVDEWLDRAATLSRMDLRKALREEFPKRMVPLPEGKYRVLYADPPWEYGNTMPEYFPDQGTYYELLTPSEVANYSFDERGIADLAADDAVLFLWATSPILEEAFDVIKTWGFEYKTSFVWDKVDHVMGHYNSVRHEFLLVCAKGSCMPDELTLFDSVVTQKRSETHSEKPEIFRQMIEALYFNGPKIELFARHKAKGWEAWGVEVS